MTLKVIPLLQAFSSAIRRTFVQYFTRFQLTARRSVPQRQLGFLLNMCYLTLCQKASLSELKMWKTFPILIHLIQNDQQATKVCEKWCVMPDLQSPFHHNPLTGTNLHVHCQSKKQGFFSFSVTLPNANWYLQFFHSRLISKFAIKSLLNIPPHLTHVSTLPCELLMSEN